MPLTWGTLTEDQWSNLSVAQWGSLLGDSPTFGEAFREALQNDASVFLDEFAEDVTYNVFGGASKVIIAFVDRQPRQPIREDGHTLADELEIFIRNDSSLGMASIQPGRDTITVAGRYGATARDHIVTTVVAGDAGMWRLRAR